MTMRTFANQHVHLMGIGGSGVSALVPLLERVGATVSGCDLAESDLVNTLRSQGIDIFIGHAVEHISDTVDLVVHSSAVPDDHPELRAARSQGIEVLSRAACLAELMRGSQTIAVAGSHGKTTTAWFTGHLLTAAGLDPVVAVGGSVPEQGVHGSRIGSGGLFVAEVDESDGGFAHVSPDIAIITNLDDEHVRHYGSFSALCDAFNRWLLAMDPRGTVIVPSTGLDPRIIAGVVQRVVRVGLHDGDIHAENLVLGAEKSEATVVMGDRVIGQLSVPAPGIHMVHNALMAVAAARVVDSGVAVDGLADCARVRRRFTVHGTVGGVRLVEDYAHHPKELLATIGAAALGGGRVHAIFQPHRWTRSADCFHDFVGAFDALQSVCVVPVYGAGESPIAGVDGRDLAEAIALRWREAGRHAARAQYAPRLTTAASFIVTQAEPGDTILILGAGDVGSVAPALLAQLPEAVG